jgi:hypothetical protein
MQVSLKRLVTLAGVLFVTGAFAAPPSIEAPKGIPGAAAADFVEGVQQTTQEIITSADTRVGFKDGERIPDNTWRCVAYTIAYGAAYKGVSLGMEDFRPALEQYNALREKWCNDNQPPNKGLEILHKAREALRPGYSDTKKRELEEAAAKFRDDVPKFAKVIGFVDFVRAWALPALRSAPAGGPGLFVYPPRPLTGPLAPKVDPNQGL